MLLLNTSLEVSDLFSVVFKVLVPQRIQGLCKTGAQVVFST